MPTNVTTTFSSIILLLSCYLCVESSAKDTKQDYPKKNSVESDLSIKARVVKHIGTCGRFCKTEKYWIEARKILYSHLSSDVHDSQIAIISVCATQGLLLGETYTFFLDINNKDHINLSALGSAIGFEDDGPCQFTAEDDSVFLNTSNDKYLRSTAIQKNKDDDSDAAYTHLIFPENESYSTEFLYNYKRKN